MANMRPSPHKNTSFWFMGDIITFIITGEDTQGVYSMIETTVPPLHEIPVHIHHREDEGFYVLEGEFSYKYGSQMITSAKKGSYTYLKKTIPHNFKNESNSQGKLLTIITPPGYENFFKELGVPITDSSSFSPPSGSPDLNKFAAVAKKYELELLSPPSSSSL
jgi:quercetin dioxygenase-like cupin family protein